MRLEALALAISLLFVGCSAPRQSFATAPGAPPTCPPPDHHYNRDSLFGKWADEDHDCQNTRAELLIARSAKPTAFTSSSGCYVDSGEWHDPYTDSTFYAASDLQIDHVVPLHLAWLSGAWAWSQEQRRAFANDTANLLAVYGRVNASKGDRTPEEWLPPSPTFQDGYRERFASILRKYSLTASSCGILGRSKQAP